MEIRSDTQGCSVLAQRQLDTAAVSRPDRFQAHNRYAIQPHREPVGSGGDSIKDWRSSYLR